MVHKHKNEILIIKMLKVNTVLTLRDFYHLGWRTVFSMEQRGLLKIEKTSDRGNTFDSSPFDWKVSLN